MTCTLTPASPRSAVVSVQPQSEEQPDRERITRANGATVSARAGNTQMTSSQGDRSSVSRSLEPTDDSYERPRRRTLPDRERHPLRQPRGYHVATDTLGLIRAVTDESGTA